jgi:hypothetical protein
MTVRAVSLPAALSPGPSSWLSRAAHSITALFHRAIALVIGYSLKICLYRLSILQSRFSKWIVAPFIRLIYNLWMRLRGIPEQLAAFDAKRLEASAAFLSEFAEIRSIQTADGATLKWALFSPQKFQKWIEENGGVREGEWIRPRTEADWKSLRRLRHFKWFEENGHAFRAPPHLPGADKICCLRCQGFGRQMPMEKATIALHLAAGFHFAIFDYRTDPSPKGFYEDAETIYQALIREGFSAKEIKAIGYCRATFVVAHLKELHHKEGLDAVMIHAPPSLRETVEHMMGPIGSLGLPSVESDGDFDSLRRLRSLPSADAATCLIMNENDTILPPNTIANLKEAVQASGRCELILEPKKEGAGDPHFEDPFRDPAILQRYFEFLLNRNSH